MKKIMLTLCLMIMSASSFAIVNFSTSTGALVMRDVVVDDKTVYDSVTLQLNLVNGTFTILDATLKDTSFSKNVIDSVTENGLKVDFYGCALTGKNQITCMTKIVAINDNLLMHVNILQIPNVNGGSRLWDNLSNEYSPSTAVALDKTSTANLQFNLIQGIPVEVKFIYNSIKSNAESISIFQPQFYFNCGYNIYSCTFLNGNFTDIDF